MYTTVNPSFTVEKWGLMGSKLYRRVFVMSGTMCHGPKDVRAIEV